MATDVRIPSLGESVTEAVIARWFKHRTKHGVDLGLMSLFARATVLTLREFRVLNARIDGTTSSITVAMQHEIFGPVLCLSAFSGRDREQALGNAVRLMNESRYGLSNAVLTNQLDVAMKAMERARTGILYIGRGTTGAELGKPFGGVKDSGHGREGAGLDEVTYLKQVYIDYHGKLRMAQAGADEVVQRVLEQSRALGESVFRG